MRKQGFSRTAIIMHWLLALGVFFLFISSWWMLSLPLSSKDYAYRNFPFQLHKNIGITLTFVLLILLYVRYRHRPKKIDAPEMTPWMHFLAAVDHVLLYVLVFACCLSGYISSAYSGWSTTLWWTVELPDWGERNKELNTLFSDIHMWITWLLLALVAVHISGAIYHAFRHDGVVRRMLRL
ncbi:MAG: cytochrome b [Thiotrichales bacterium]|nr:cytochrome b [Thiotrichales bacterium]